MGEDAPHSERMRALAASKTLTPSQLSLRGRAGAHALHASRDSREVTRAARAASPGQLGYWEHSVDPDGALESGERSRRAAHARKAYFARLALKSAQARHARKARA